MDHIALLNLLASRCTLEDLRKICFLLDVNPERVPHHTQIDSFARELILLAQRTGQFDALVAAAKQVRPDLFGQPITPDSNPNANPNPPMNPSKLSGPDSQRLISILSTLPQWGSYTTRNAFIEDALASYPRRRDVMARLDLDQSDRRTLASNAYRVLDGFDVVPLLIAYMLTVMDGSGEEVTFIRGLQANLGNATGVIASAQPLGPSLADIDNKLDRQHQQHMGALKYLAQMQLEVHRMLGVIKAEQISQLDLTWVVAEVQHWAQTVRAELKGDNAELIQQLDVLTAHTASENQYLLATLPIIPGILSYNVEIGSQHQVDLKALWGKITSKLLPAPK